MLSNGDPTLGRAALAMIARRCLRRRKRFAARCENLSFMLSFAAVLSMATAPARAQDGYQYPSKVNVSWNRLNNYDEVVQIMKDLTAAYPDLLTLQSLGKSYQNRDMWEITLNVAKTG